ncbi:MAG TPA: hypothetical protein VNO50_11030 [Pyrinomonadaceae bacterium]|nr:hypothetical protein [Pyrinomonadaceae bacterium]
MQQARIGPPLWFLLLLLLLPSALEARTFPLRGVVTNPRRDRVAIRTGPPSATTLAYRLEEIICSVGDGTEFIATEEVYIANGEIWFKVNTTKLVDSTGCAANGVAGWMVAKIKTVWVVTVLQEGISVPAAPLVRQTVATERRTEERKQQQEAKGQPPRKRAISYKPVLDYCLLVIGTLIGVVIVSIERSKKVAFKEWLSSLAIFEFITLSLVNILVVALLIDQLYEVPEPSFLFHVLKVAQASPGGFVLLGFILSAILLKFVSFAKS